MHHAPICRTNWLWRLVLLAAGAISVAGCGSDLGSTVAGTVTLDGQALHTGTVTFHRVNEGAAAYGRIGAGGQYEISTGTVAGLEPGEYRVTVVAVEIVPAANSNDAPGGRRITPERYQNLDSTDLRAQIAPGGNSIDLMLTSSS